MRTLSVNRRLQVNKHEKKSEQLRQSDTVFRLIRKEKNCKLKTYE